MSEKYEKKPFKISKFNVIRAKVLMQLDDPKSTICKQENILFFISHILISEMVERKIRENCVILTERKN